MAAYAAIHGQQRLQRLLEGMVRNEPRRYPKNTPIVAAAGAKGEWPDHRNPS